MGNGKLGILECCTVDFAGCYDSSRSSNNNNNNNDNNKWIAFIWRYSPP